MQISSMVHLQYISYFTSCALWGSNYTYCYSCRRMLVNSLDSWDAVEIAVCTFNEGKPKDVTITQISLKVSSYQHQHKRNGISLKVTLLSLVHILFGAHKPNSLDTWFLRYFLNTSWRLTKAQSLCRLGQSPNISPPYVLLSMHSNITICQQPQSKKIWQSALKHHGKQFCRFI